MSIQKLRRIENLSQVDKIEMSLQEYLRTENFQPGDPLPKEMELAKAMGVSRTAIREALSRFRTLGIIESRKNRGMLIARPDVFNIVGRILTPQLLDEDTLNEIFEMRLVIEVGLGDLLFLHRHNIDFKKLNDIIKKEQKATQKLEIVKYDIEAECRSVFANVKAVLEASGSSWDKIVDVTVFLTNMKKDFPVYNKIYGEYFAGVEACRTTVEVKSLPTPICIELKVIATL